MAGMSQKATMRIDALVAMYKKDARKVMVIKKELDTIMKAENAMVERVLRPC